PECAVFPKTLLTAAWPLDYLSELINESTGLPTIRRRGNKRSWLRPSSPTGSLPIERPSCFWSSADTAEL
ncbi:MAG TPA: hypothetical protein VFS38_04465, partial [Actinomycetota bacterium]|nr:hypothetical protein [Actinomycetota bacterium]